MKRYNHLTRRQEEILKLIARGLSNKEIAVALCLTVSAVEQHAQNIYRNLNVRGRVEAAVYAVQHNILS